MTCGFNYRLAGNCSGRGTTERIQFFREPGLSRIFERACRIFRAGRDTGTE